MQPSPTYYSLGIKQASPITDNKDRDAWNTYTSGLLHWIDTFSAQLELRSDAYRLLASKAWTEHGYMVFPVGLKTSRTPVIVLRAFWYCATLTWPFDLDNSAELSVYAVGDDGQPMTLGREDLSALTDKMQVVVATFHRTERSIIDSQDFKTLVDELDRTKYCVQHVSILSASEDDPPIDAVMVFAMANDFDFRLVTRLAELNGAEIIMQEVGPMAGVVNYRTTFDGVEAMSNE